MLTLSIAAGQLTSATARSSQDLVANEFYQYDTDFVDVALSGEGVTMVFYVYLPWWLAVTLLVSVIAVPMWIGAQLGRAFNDRRGPRVAPQAGSKQPAQVSHHIRFPNYSSLVSAPTSAGALTS